MEKSIFIQKWIDNMKFLQEQILSFLEKDEGDQYNYNNLINQTKELQIQKNKHFLKAYLHLISKIADNHYQNNNFYAKIEMIIKIFQDDIQKEFSNFDIFNIFKRNKRIILFLLKEKIIIPDHSIANIILKNRYKERFYPQYFYNEFKSFLTQDFVNLTTFISKDFEFDREKGQNDDYICHLIRNDIIDEFISYSVRSLLKLTYQIKPSIFETNLFLLKHKKVTLIQYAAFYGAIQIFQYLKVNNVKLTPNLWLFAIHSQNAELIHILERDGIIPDDGLYEKCYLESVKCHHIEFINYFKQNYYQYNEKINIFDVLKSFNFIELSNNDYIPDSINTHSLLSCLCKNDYCELFDIILNSNKRYEVNGNMMNFYLYCAVEKGNKEIVKLLLEMPEIQINEILLGEKGENRKSLLYIAAENGNFEIFKQLLSRNDINVNIQSVYKEGKVEYSQTVLHYAVEQNNVKMANQILLKKSINANEMLTLKRPKKKVQKTALHLAFELKNTEMIRFLLSVRNIDINAKSMYKKGNKELSETILHKAVKKNNLQIVSILLQDENINVNSMLLFKDKEKMIRKTPLQIAVGKENLDMIKLLLSAKNIDIFLKSKCTINGNTEEKSALYSAVEKNNFEIVTILLKKYGTDKYKKRLLKRLNTNEKTELHAAVDQNNFKIIQLLLSLPAIKTSNDLSIYREDIKNILYVSIDQDNLQFFKKLLIKLEEQQIFNYFINRETSSYKGTILHYAVSKGSIEIVKFLCTLPYININDKLYFERDNSKEEKTALHIAIEKDHTKIIDFLIQNPKTDVNALFKGKYSLTYIEKPVLHMLVEKYNLNSFKYLLARDDLDVNAKSFKNGEETVINMIVRYKNLEMLQYLLERPDINVNEKSIYYEYYDYYCRRFDISPLFMISYTRNIDMLNLILSREEIDVNQKSFKYKGDYIFNAFKVEKELTALHIALELYYLEIAEKLIMHNSIDINVKSIKYMDDCILDKLSKKEEQNALHIAVDHKYSTIVKLIINSKNVDVNEKSIYYIKEKPNDDYIKIEKTALNIAVEKNYLNITKHLLSHPKIDVNSKSTKYMNQKSIYDYTKEEQTALHSSILNENQEIFELLLNRKDVDINFKYSYKVIEKGVEHDYDIQTKDENDSKQIEEENDSKPIENESDSKQIEDESDCKKIELNNDNEIDESDDDDDNDYDDINYEIDKEIYEFEKTALHIAIEKNNLMMVKSLLFRDDVDANIKFAFFQKKSIYSGILQYKNALVIAIEQKSIDIIDCLLNSHKINVNFLFTQPSCVVYKNDKVKKLQVVKKTALHMACEINNYEIVAKLLLQEDIEINEPLTVIMELNDRENFIEKTKTALIIAIENENLPIFQLLVSHPKFEIYENFIFYSFENIKTKINHIEFVSALHRVIEKEHYQMLLYMLISPKINLNEKTSISSDSFIPKIDDKTELYMAVERRDINLIKLLLASNRINVYEKSIFRIAKDEENKVIDEKTAMDIAIEKNEHEIIELINKHIENHTNDKISDIEVSQIKESDATNELSLTLTIPLRIPKFITVLERSGWKVLFPICIFAYFLYLFIKICY